MFNTSLQFLVYGWRHFLCAAFLLSDPCKSHVCGHTDVLHARLLALQPSCGWSARLPSDVPHLGKPASASWQHLRCNCARAARVA